MSPAECLPIYRAGRNSVERKRAPAVAVTSVILLLLCQIVFAKMASAAYAADTAVEDQQQYCQADTFQASCSDGQVVSMIMARHGRMKKGKCVKGDYGSLGCQIDALPFMDAKCSGWRQCQFRIFDTKLRERSPCPDDVASYLEATYKCIDVVTVNSGQCAGQKQIILTDARGYLASAVSEDYGLGTIECPWVVRAPQGQRITFSLRYFGTESQAVGGVGETGMRGSLGLCYDLVTFREAGTEQQKMTTCDGLHSERDVLASRTNDVQVQLVGKMQLRTLGKFLIRYQVTGCADPVAPFNATVKREGDKLIVKCNNSDHTWYLVCRNSSWLGDTVNCNHGSASAWNLRQIFDSSSFPFGILLVVAIGVALGIFCGGLLLTCVVVYMKRQRRFHQAMDECADFRNLDGYEGQTTGDLTDLATPDDDLLSQVMTGPGGKTVHPPYTATRHYVGAGGCGLQGSSSGISSIDHISDYDRQFASIKSYGVQKMGGGGGGGLCPERCNYPSTNANAATTVGKNHLYEMPHAV